jgi:hypothetical protein
MKQPTDQFIVYPRRGRLALMLLVSLLFIAGLLWLRSKLNESGAAGSLKIWFAVVLGLPFFGLCAIYLAFRLIVPKPALVATKEGLWLAGTALSPGLVRWDEIAGLQVFDTMGQKSMGVRLLNEHVVLEPMGWHVRWLAKANSAISGCAFHVPQSVLPMTAEELIARVHEFRVQNGIGLPSR